MLATQPSTSHTSAPSRRLRWPHGEAELQALGAMLAPVTFRTPGLADFSPMQVAPWADEPGAGRMRGLLSRLRGEWPCVPFGRCDRPDGLPADWPERSAGDDWGHGYPSHHAWRWLELGDPLALALQIEPPADQKVQRMTRIVRAVADAPALEIELAIEVRAACVLPVALHPTLRLDAGRVELSISHEGPGLTYPVPAEPGRSRLAANARFERLDAVPLQGGGHADLTRYPQAADSEDLLQLMHLRGPVTAHYLDEGWALTLDWDRTLLPDLMLWISHRGRQYPPWNGRHFALGLEPLNGAWDLGRVTDVPSDHPLAARRGLALTPDAPCVIRYRLSAEPEGAPMRAPR